MSIEMKLELGHRASVRDKPTPEGFTHDWVVFVKGAEGTDINHFVEKVVFHLHESFPKPRRVVKESPYQVAESGYAGFIMPIEVYFRSKEEPKKVRFEYDLFLRLEGSPVYNIRREKLTFQNPSEDFRRKLLLAKGAGFNSGSSVGSGTPSLQTQTGTSVQHIEETSRTPTSHTKHTPVAEKKIKSHSTPKESSHSSHSKPNKILPPPSLPPVSSTNKESKSSSKVNHSPEVKETGKSKSSSSKSEKEPKPGSKRPHPPDSQNHHSSSEKKKRHHSNSDEKHDTNNNEKPPKETKEKKEKHKSNKVLSGHGTKKEKHKSSHSHSSSKEVTREVTKSPSKSLTSTTTKSPSSSRLSNEDSNDAKPLKPTIKDSSSSSPSPDLVNATETWCEISPEKIDPTVEKEMLSPMSPDLKPPPVTDKSKQNNNSHHDSDNNIDEKPPSSSKHKNDKSPKLKSSQKTKKLPKPPPPPPPVNNSSNNNNNNRSVKQNGAVVITKETNNHMSPPAPVNKSTKTTEKETTLDPAYVRELIDLQRKIMALDDRNLLQKVVDVIQETGHYQMTTKSFDFDLCSLDQSTVRRLKHCLSL